MFRNANGKSRGPRSAQMETLIGPQVEIEGDLAFRGGLYVEGRVRGAVRGSGEDAVLTLAEGGRIEGEVRATVAIVRGQLHGDVHASERVELSEHARVEGDIYYRVLEMAAGATVTGRLVHAEEPAKQLCGPEPAGATT